MKKRVMALLMAGLLAAGVFASPMGNLTVHATEDEVQVEEVQTEEASDDEMAEETVEVDACEDFSEISLVSYEHMFPDIDNDDDLRKAVENMESGVMNQQIECDTASEYESTTDGYLYEGQDGAISWKIDTDGVLYLNGNGDFEGYYLEDFRKQVPNWITVKTCNVIKKAVVNIAGITSLKNLFFYCDNMQSVDLSGLDTSKVTDMSGMFNGCGKLETLDLSNFNTSNVVSMADMMLGCNRITNIKLGDWDTSKVTDMSCMFACCLSIEEIDVSKFETGSVTDIEGMFEACKSLKKVDFSNHDLSKVQYAEAMFQRCHSIEKIDLSGTKWSSLKEVSHIFNQCYSLKEVDVSGFDVNKVKCLRYMFAECNTLQELDVSNFITSNVTDMTSMYLKCGIKKMDISMFQMNKNPRTMYMFYRTSLLEEVNLPDEMVAFEDEMFYDCPNLKYIYTPQSLESIETDVFTGSENTILYCYEDSYAHTWATENGQPYQLIDHTHEYKETALVNANCQGKGLYRETCTHDGCKAYYTTWKQGPHTIVTDKGVAATCTKSGLTEGSHCSVCNTVLTAQQTIPATGHTEVKDKAVKATCTKSGLTEGSHCSVCNTVLTAQQTIPATGHTIVTDKAVEATCTKTGLTEGSHCSTCNKVMKEQKTVAKKAHDYKEVTTKAKIDKKGSIKTLCTGCGKQKGKTTTINAIKTVKLSKTSYTYNGKEQKPSVTVKDTKGNTLKKNTDYKITYSEDSKNPGKYTVTIKFKGNYTGTKKLTYTIKPKTVSGVKVSAKSKGFKVTWKQGTKITGYQIQYSTSKKFEDKKTETKTITSSKTTSKTISKLKAKKKYYVRVRAYKTVKIDGKNVKVYSSWSDVKTVTTKK